MPMKPKSAQRISLALHRGGFVCLLLFLLFGVVIYAFLFLTVHNRDVSTLEFNQRYNDSIKVWIEHGYFKHGGLAFRRPVTEDPQQKIWRSSPMGFIQAAHLLERISYAWKGGFSQRLMCFHNQAIIWISSALLGFLVFRVVLQYDGRLVSASLLGVSCQAVYQTFPFNLYNYWEIFPNALMCMFAIAYLIIVEQDLRRDPTTTWNHWLRGIFVFGIFYMEPFTAPFFLATYYLVVMVMKPSLRTKQRHVRTILMPALVAIGIYLGQLAYVKWTYPEVNVAGSGFLFRTGFDGSIRYVGDQFALLFARLKFVEPGIGNWKYFFISGLLSMIYLVMFKAKDARLQPIRMLLLISVGLYVPFAFFFSQCVAIHPYAYDTHLVIPLILSLLAFLPCHLERITKQTATFVVIAALVAFCYSMVQLRTYAIAYPLEPIVTSFNSHQLDSPSLEDNSFPLEVLLPIITKIRNDNLASDRSLRDIKVE